MGKYLVAVLRYSHQQSDPIYTQQLTQIILLSTINIVGICKHGITILILYQISSSHASIQDLLSVFSAHSFTSTHPSSIFEMWATVYTLQITSIKTQNLHYRILLKQACHFLCQHTSTT